MVKIIECINTEEFSIDEKSFIKKSSENELYLVNTNGICTKINENGPNYLGEQFQIVPKLSTSVICQFASEILFISPNKSHMVYMSKLEDIPNSSVILKFAGPVSCMYYNAKKHTLFCGSFDFSISSYNIKTQAKKSFSDLSSPPVSILAFEKLNSTIYIDFDGVLHFLDGSHKQIIFNKKYSKKYVKDNTNYLSTNDSENKLSVSLVDEIKILSLPKFEPLISISSQIQPSICKFIFDEYLIFTNFEKTNQITLQNIISNSKIILKFTKLSAIEDFEFSKDKIFLISENDLSVFENIKSVCNEEDCQKSPIKIKKKRKIEDIEDEEIDSIPIKIEKKLPINNIICNFQPTAINFNKADDYYIVWNTVGTIARVRSGLDKRSLIKITFHDVTLHSQIVLNNDSDFIIGDLAENNIVLVSKFSLEKPTKLFCLCFLLNRDTEWSKNINSKITNVSSSSNFIGVALPNSISIYSLSGIHLNEIPLIGPIISLVAKDFKFYTIEQNTSYNDEQSLINTYLCQHFQFSNIFQYKNTNSIILFEKEKYFKWAGFSTDDRCIVIDSDCVVHIASMSLNSSMPVWDKLYINIEDLKLDDVHIHSVDLYEAVCYCIVSNTGSKILTPQDGSVGRTKNLTLNSTKNPLLSLSDQLENSIIMQNILDRRFEIPGDNAELNLKLTEKLFKMYALFCKNNEEVKAYEIATIMRKKDLIEKCVMYASSLKLYSLINDLNRITK